MTVTIYKNQSLDAFGGGSKAAIRFDVTGSVNVASLAVGSETVSKFSILRIWWSTSNNITIARGANNKLTLYGTDHWDLANAGMSLTEDNTANLVVTINTGGSCIIEVGKQ